MGQNKRYDRRSLSPEVTPKERELLVRLMEECAEVQVAASKTLRWGWDSTHPHDRRGETNEDSLRRELDDVRDMVARLMNRRDWT